MVQSRSCSSYRPRSLFLRESSKVNKVERGEGVVNRESRFPVERANGPCSYSYLLFLSFFLSFLFTFTVRSQDSLEIQLLVLRPGKLLYVFKVPSTQNKMTAQKEWKFCRGRSSSEAPLLVAERRCKPVVLFRRGPSPQSMDF